MRFARVLVALGLPLCAACGVINGIKGPQGEPGSLGWTWTGPQPIDEGGAVESDNPRLALGQGKLWLAFQAYDSVNTKGSVWVTRQSLNGSWATPKAVPHQAAWDGGEDFPQIAVGGAGDPVLAFGAYTSAQPGSTSIWAARVKDSLDLTVSDVARLEPASSSSAYLSQGHSIAVDAAGNALVVWGAGSTISANVSAGGTTWSTAAQLDSSSDVYSTIEVAAGSSGSAIAGWSRGFGSSAEAVALPIDISGGLLVPGTPKSLLLGSGTTNAHFGMNGSAALAVFADGSTVSSQAFDGSWGAKQTFVNGDLASYSIVTLATNAKGQAVVAWRDSSQGAVDAYGAVLKAAFWDGSAWTPAGIISLPGSGRKVWWTSCDLDDSGSAVCAWADFDAGGTYTRIWAAVMRLDLQGAPSWTPAEPIDADSPGVYLADKPENVRDITVKLDPQGSGATVVWIQHGPGSDSSSHTWTNTLR